MARRAKKANIANHLRQKKYLDEGTVMLPTLAEEAKKEGKKIKTRRLSHRIKGPGRIRGKFKV